MALKEKGRARLLFPQQLMKAWALTKESELGTSLDADYFPEWILNVLKMQDPETQLQLPVHWTEMSAVMDTLYQQKC